MKLFRPSIAHNLPEWLEIATGGLVPSAQSHVRMEIGAHFAEAVQNQLANGLSESAAHAAALADLGEARAAARRFRREFLTKKEAWYVDWRNKSAISPLGTFLACLLIPGVVFPNLATWPSDDGLAKIIAAAAMLLAFLEIALIFATWFLAQGKMTLAILRRIVLLDTFAAGNFIVLVLICGCEEKSGGIRESGEMLNNLTYILFLAWGAGIPINFLRLHRKLQTTHGDDLRPA